jgi:5-methylcytosine-specific restriction endonuclease McrA
MRQRSTYLLAQGEAWLKARMRALVRDEFTCQHPDCGETRLAYLEVHHIQPRIQGGTHDLANLLTLCRQHHAERHPHLRKQLEHAAPELTPFPWREL